MIDSRQPSSIAARMLTIVGTILIVAYLLDCAIVLFPPNFLDRPWQMAFTSQIVERGILPMVGLGLIFAGYGIESNAGGGSPSNRKPFLDIKFWSLVLSSLLGLLFLLLFPLHLNNVRLDRNEKLGQITTRAEQAELQVTSQVSNADIQKEIEKQQTLVKTQLAELVKDPQKLDEAIKSGRVPKEQAELLQRFKQDPQAIDQFVQQQFNAETLSNRELSRIRGNRQQLEDQTKLTSLKSGLQTGISSLLLAFGYMAIGWTGLKNLGYVKVGRRKNAPR
ncbi:MAG: HpsJ family protein [Microcoleus vaginatus WJT46-NPBG5]|jgi:hypothetical protein|nr:HpsJ family protein [Microcoleus vaginatus WJT46-NPBG5]